MNLDILFLYPDMLDLYADNNNIDILKYRAKKRGIDVNIASYTIGDKKPDFSKYDLVFLAPSGDDRQKIIIEDLIKYKKEIQKSIDDKVFYLLISGGYILFGDYYINHLDEKIKCLNIFDYYSKDSINKKESCIGDIVVDCIINNKNIKVLGFENHTMQIYDVKNPIGKVLFGNGNYYKSEYEGFMLDNVIATSLHGPVLSKNPEIADYILKYCLERKYNKKIDFKEINDEFEIIAKKEMLDKLLDSSNI